MALRSYVNGSWTSPSAEGLPLLDAVTGEQVATISSAGIDMRAALEYGRAVGGPALRELTFHQRAAVLKSLGLFLREHRPELYALSARTGATLYDAKFDVDGGIGVLPSYASKGRRELPDAGRRRRGTGRHPRRHPLHAAHRRPGQPADAHPDHRPLGTGR